MIIDHTKFKQSLGKFVTGVIIASISCDNKNYGVTINSFNSVSLDPPLILFSLNKNSFLREFFIENSFFAINILAASQKNLANKFAKPKDIDWHKIEFSVGQYSKAPILNEIISFLECKIEKIIEAGDHEIIIGRIVNLEILNSADPLIYFEKNYYQLGEKILD